MLRRLRAAPSFAIASAFALASAAIIAPVTTAHSAQEAGDYTLEIGWLNEPAYVAQPNAVQVTVKDHRGLPVNDLGTDDLAAVVSTAGQDSPKLTFEPGFDAAEGEGPLGQYDAAIVPTAPGDYTFQITGSIHGTAVDLSVTSGPETFDAVQGSSDLQFPAKLPNLTEVATRLDRIDLRVQAVQSALPPQGIGAAATEALAASQDASDMAVLAMIVGVGIAAIGLVIALAALVIALRVRRAGTSKA